MSKIGNNGFVKESLSKNQFQIKKKYGQNFLTNQTILKQIVQASLMTKNDAVIEIGPGLGALTELLCEKAGFVLAYEIDQELLPILEENLKPHMNYKILLNDILKANIAKDIETYLKKYDKIYVVANLPYYITTPILLKLLSQKLPIIRYIVMMQLEVANRICGKPSTKEYNALSVWVEYRATATKLFKVSRNDFIPSPNVDSAVVAIDVLPTPYEAALDEQEFDKLIRQCFAQRRKTLYNNLSLLYGKEMIEQMLNELRIPLQIRAEALELKDFIAMSNYITHSLKQ